MVERKPRPLVMRGKLTGDQVYLPAPITTRGTLENIKWSEFPTEEEKQLKAELTRMFEIYERHRAWYQPTKLGDKLAWTVMFPLTSKYKCGPTEIMAATAMDKNYRLNKKFSGEQELAKGTGETPLSVDQIIDRALKQEASELKEIQSESNLPPFS